MARLQTLLSVGLAALLPLVQAQCSNEVAIYNPALRSQTGNETWFIVPVNKTAVQSALDFAYGQGNVLLGEVPSSDTTLFPSGFDDDKHPVIANIGYVDDTRMSAFQIAGALLTGNVYATYLRRPNSQPGTVLNAQISGYISGPNDQSLPAVVPSTVSTLVEGYAVRLGHFLPNDAAYQLNGDVLSNSLAWNVVPNQISGPGVYIEAVDFQYVPSSNPNTLTTPKLFKAVLNQPSILAGAYLANNTCQRNQYYFNNATGVMLPRSGNVTFGPAADGLLQTQGIIQKSSPDGSGFFAGLDGFSACAQNVGYNPKTATRRWQMLTGLRYRI